MVFDTTPTDCGLLSVPVPVPNGEFDTLQAVAFAIWNRNDRLLCLTFQTKADPMPMPMRQTFRGLNETSELRVVGNGNIRESA